MARPGEASTPALSRRPSSLTCTRPDTSGGHGLRRRASLSGAASVTLQAGARGSPPSAPSASRRRSPGRGRPPRCGGPGASASSRYCVVSSTVTPSPSSSRMASHTRWRLVGSKPVVGSSRNSTGGRVMRSRRQVQPAPHAARVALEHPVGRVGQLELGEQLGRPGPRRRPAHVGELADQDQVLAPGQQRVERGVLGGHADVASHLARVLHDVDRRPRWPGPRRAAPAWSGPARPWSCRPRSGRAARGWFRRARRSRPRPGPASRRSRFVRPSAWIISSGLVTTIASLPVG